MAHSPSVKFNCSVALLLFMRFKISLSTRFDLTTCMLPLPKTIIRGQNCVLSLCFYQQNIKIRTFCIKFLGKGPDSGSGTLCDSLIKRFFEKKTRLQMTNLVLLSVFNPFSILNLLPSLLMFWVILFLNGGDEGCDAKALTL